MLAILQEQNWACTYEICNEIMYAERQENKFKAV